MGKTEAPAFVRALRRIYQVMDDLLPLDLDGASWHTSKTGLYWFLHMPEYAVRDGFRERLTNGETLLASNIEGIVIWWYGNIPVYIDPELPDNIAELRNQQSLALIDFPERE